MTQIHKSPNEKRTARFAETGEIRFGPAYFSLSVDNLAFGERIFGHHFAWSDDDRFLALQEWHNTKESLGPRTSLVLLDLEKTMEAGFETFHGFAIPRSFSGHLLRHDDENWGSGSCVKIEKETDLDLIDWWKDIAQQCVPPNTHSPSAQGVGGR
jgi:hypothetical protein